MIRKPKVPKHVVSRKEYVITKVVATGSTIGFVVCCIGIALLLLNLPYSANIDAHNMDFIIKYDTFTRYGVAWFACMFFIPCFAIGATFFWFGGRKSRRTIRFMEPSVNAQAYGLPISKTLVRATEEPATKQQAELLRCAQKGQETPAELLLRATQTNGQD